MTVDFPVSARGARFLCFISQCLAIWFGGAFTRAHALEAVELAWTPSPSTNVVAYNVHYGTTSGFYTYSVLSYSATGASVSGLAAGQTYYFAVSAISDQGEESGFSNEAFYTVPLPTNAVALPTNLVIEAHLTSPDSQDVELTWNSSAEADVLGYKVYYGTTSLDYADSVTYYYTSDAIMTGLAGGTTYYFAVAAIGVDGEEGNLSSEVSVAVPVPLPLVLQAQGVSPASQDVELGWNPSPNREVYGYMVYYWPQSGDWTNSTFFYTADGVISGLSGGMTYYFTVAPIGVNGVESNLSNIASVEVPAALPLVLQAQGGLLNSSAVELTWDPRPNSDVYGYMVYYGTQSGAYTSSAVFYYTTHGVISGLAGGTTYYFAVSAIGANGVENMLSNEASFAVPVPPPAVLETQPFTDGGGQLHLQINTYTVVNGPWEMDYSTDLKNWYYYTSGYGYGNGDGYDVYVDAPVDPAEPQMFYSLRTANAVPVPPPIVHQAQTSTDSSGQSQPVLMQTTPIQP